MSQRGPMIDGKRIRKDIKKLTGEDLPISGGCGNSKDDPIIIEEKDAARSSYVIYQVVKFIHMMRGEHFNFVQSTLYDENSDGRYIEQYKIEREGDDENYYNYYFDITAMHK